MTAASAESLCRATEAKPEVDDRQDALIGEMTSRLDTQTRINRALIYDAQFPFTTREVRHGWRQSPYPFRPAAVADISDHNSGLYRFHYAQDDLGTTVRGRAQAGPDLPTAAGPAPLNTQGILSRNHGYVTQVAE